MEVPAPRLHDRLYRLMFGHDAQWAQEALDMMEDSPDESWTRAELAFSAIVRGDLVEPDRVPDGFMRYSLEVPQADGEIQAMALINQIFESGIIYGLSADAKIRIAKWFLSWANEQARLEREHYGV